VTGRILRTDAALNDLNEQAKFIQRDSPEAAIRFLAAAEATFHRLAAMPELGERQQFGLERLAGLRAWQVRGFDNHLIYYRPIEGGVEIIRVLHAARDVAAIFEDQG
jgi:toxin ParE1/3/4